MDLSKPTLPNSFRFGEGIAKRREGLLFLAFQVVHTILAHGASEVAAFQSFFNDRFHSFFKIHALNIPVSIGMVLILKPQIQFL